MQRSWGPLLSSSVLYVPFIHLLLQLNDNLSVINSKESYSEASLFLWLDIFLSRMWKNNDGQETEGKVVLQVCFVGFFKNQIIIVFFRLLGI